MGAAGNPRRRCPRAGCDRSRNAARRTARGHAGLARHARIAAAARARGRARGPVRRSQPVRAPARLQRGSDREDQRRTVAWLSAKGAALLGDGRFRRPVRGPVDDQASRQRFGQPRPARRTREAGPDAAREPAAHLRLLRRPRDPFDRRARTRPGRGDRQACRALRCHPGRAL